MKKLTFVLLMNFMLITLVIDYSFGAPPPKDAIQYEQELKNVNIELSKVNKRVVRRWLGSYDSAYPDLAEKLLEILKDRSPIGQPVQLDVIEGRYREVKGKQAGEYIPPPHELPNVKKAYIHAWEEVNPIRGGKLIRDNDTDDMILDKIAPRH